MIYFIQAQTGHIKIGHTNGDPRTRLADLQTGNPTRLVLLRVVPGDRSVEQALHRRFASARSHGEWFRPCAELLAYLGAGAGMSRSDWQDSRADDAPPPWGCPHFGWPEHDWLDCPECLDRYEHYLEQEAVVEGR